MDADRFDALSRALTSAPSRRKTLGALLGALFASALPGLSPDTRAAARKRNGRDVGAATHCLPPGAKPCKKGDQCCSGRCKRKKKKCLDCATGTEYCAAQEKCVAPGQCGSACPPCSGGSVCNPSTGSCTCPDDKPTRCNGQCTDPRSDKNFCSAFSEVCGSPCAPGDDYQCCDGQCTFLPGCTTNSNMTDCQKNHCGECGNPCLDEGSACCDGVCVPVDDKNCGVCGNDCVKNGGPGWSCINGTCTPPSGG